MVTCIRVLLKRYKPRPFINMSTPVLLKRYEPRPFITMSTPEPTIIKKIVLPEPSSRLPCTGVYLYRPF